MADTGPEHAAPASSSKLQDFLATKAKAFAAGLVPLITGEILAILADPTFTADVKAAVPAQLVFAVPVVIGLISGLITHQVPNKPQE